MRCWHYWETTEIPGTMLERVWANGPDATQNGRLLAEKLRRQPPGKRGVLVQDLGGGSSPDSRQWWKAGDDAQARAILRDGVREVALAETVAFMSRVWDAYAFHNGPPLDFLASNIEEQPGRWFPRWPAGFHWDKVKAARGVEGQADREATETVERWASGQLVRCLRATLVGPYRAHVRGADSTVIVNIGGCNWREPHHDSNGWLMFDEAPDGVSSPMIYLTDAACGEEKTKANILAHSSAAYRRCARPLVPCLGDCGFNGNSGSRKGAEWRDAWETFARLMLSERPTDAVMWWNQPPYGEKPSADEMRFMGRVIRECGGR